MKRLHELTHLQRQFAEEHQDTVFRFLSHKGLPVEDYYDIVIFGYLHAVQEYDEKESACYEDDGRIYYEAEADFDGEKQTLTRNLAFGQVSYITTYHVEDIPDGQLGYIVTEDFLAPAKGVDLVERLYHDIFDELETAQDYADNLKLHGFKYPTSIVTFLVCNKESVLQTEWYKQQKEAMRLMEEKGQTYLDDSFHIFARRHIENLKKLSTKENA